MTAPPTDRAARRRAGLSLAGIALAVLAGVAAAVSLPLAHHATAPRPTAPAPTASRTASPASVTALGAVEDALARRPMLQLPPEDAQPQALTTATAGPPMVLPPPTQTRGRWIPGGFPATPLGAVAQLTALDQTALIGGDPQVYATGYRQLSQPGAPDPASTGLAVLLTSMRGHAGLAAGGPIAGLTVTYQVDAAQIKGTADGGRWVVACVLGQFSAGYTGQITTIGVGDCQALTWTGAGWRIAAGAMAFPAPCAWPGSTPAVDAGYRAVS